MKNIMTKREAANYLGISTRTINRLMTEGKLNPYRINPGYIRSHLRFELSDLKRFKEENKILNK